MQLVDSVLKANFHNIMISNTTRETLTILKKP